MIIVVSVYPLILSIIVEGKLLETGMGKSTSFR